MSISFPWILLAAKIHPAVMSESAGRSGI